MRYVLGDSQRRGLEDGYAQREWEYPGGESTLPIFQGRKRRAGPIAGMPVAFNMGQLDPSRIGRRLGQVRQIEAIPEPPLPTRDWSQSGRS